MFATKLFSTSMLFTANLIPTSELCHLCAAIKMAGVSRYHLMDDSCLLYNCWRGCYRHGHWCINYHSRLRLWMELQLSRWHHRLHRLSLHRLTLTLEGKVLLISTILLLVCRGVCDPIVLHLIWYSSIQIIINKV